ncbi:MAG: amino acid ABC transporter permease [Candidatus Thiosymbion ectosymbiont of Robbea hypermnestra]|nr:amino acid ABC transporter permease [Candidatus Thiosymbion ectosymbiont of Robbea hypermnestra]
MSTPRFTRLGDESVHALLVQFLFLAAVVGLLVFLVFNTLANLESRGIETGFGFLARESGFGISQTLISYTETSSFGRVFVIGLLNTLLVSVLGIVLATLLGFLIGIARLSRNWLVARLAAVYIETFRNVPLLLQVFFWYVSVLTALPHPRNSHALGEAVFLNQRGFFVPRPLLLEGAWLVLGATALAIVVTFLLVHWSRRRRERTGRPLPVIRYALLLLIGLPGIAFFVAGRPVSWEFPVLQGFNFQGGLTIIPELMALLISLTIYTAAFIAEIVRAGIQSVPHGQTEAASALGLSRSQRLRLILIPQALRVIVPPLTSQYLNLVKNSSLATAIGYPDLVNVFAGTTTSITGQAIEIIAMTMVVYLAVSLSISAFMNWYNARIALTGH